MSDLTKLRMAGFTRTVSTQSEFLRSFDVFRAPWRLP
jgi:hypothetical protein